MMDVKKFLRPLYVPIINYKSSRIYKHFELVSNFRNDYKRYKKYSTIFSNRYYGNKEAELILNYHSLEKGMLFKKMKPGFAAYRIKNLHQLLNDSDVKHNIKRSQVKVAYQIMCKYYELHQDQNFDLGNLFSKAQYELYKSLIKDDYDANFEGISNFSKDEFYQNIDGDFLEFSHSRKSVRDFTGHLISNERISAAIQLANTAPSVCNRQASNVYLIEDKNKIDKVLAIQGGFSGYSTNVMQLLVVTNDRKYYYTIGERNQLFIDGGLYLMNLLYALHYYKIGNCPANWGKTIADEEKLASIIDIPESEKIICMIPIGEVVDNFRTTLSERRPIIENFKKL